VPIRHAIALLQEPATTVPNLSERSLLNSTGFWKDQGILIRSKDKNLATALLEKPWYDAETNDRREYVGRPRVRNRSLRFHSSSNVVPSVIFSHRQHISVPSGR
jgi:hypothetical protein